MDKIKRSRKKNKKIKKINKKLISKKYKRTKRIKSKRLSRIKRTKKLGSKFGDYIPEPPRLRRSSSSSSVKSVLSNIGRKISNTGSNLINKIIPTRFKRKRYSDIRDDMLSNYVDTGDLFIPSRNTFYSNNESNSSFSASSEQLSMKRRIMKEVDDIISEKIDDELKKRYLENLLNDAHRLNYEGKFYGNDYEETIDYIERIMIDYDRLLVTSYDLEFKVAGILNEPDILIKKYSDLYELYREYYNEMNQGTKEIIFDNINNFLMKRYNFSDEDIKEVNERNMYSSLLYYQPDKGKYPREMLKDKIDQYIKMNDKSMALNLVSKGYEENLLLHNEFTNYVRRLV